MKKLIYVGAAATLFLASCESYEVENGLVGTRPIKEIPEGVLKVVAPNQDLNDVRIDMSDGCYVYRHVGPVETVFLPLRATSGQPICTKLPDAANGG